MMNPIFVVLYMNTAQMIQHLLTVHTNTDPEDSAKDVGTSTAVQCPER